MSIGNNPESRNEYRQWLVGMALQGLLANELAMNTARGMAGGTLENLPFMAISYADLTIAQLEKTNP